MKVLMINGSPNSKGCTNTADSPFLFCNSRSLFADTFFIDNMS